MSRAMQGPPHQTMIRRLRKIGILVGLLIASPLSAQESAVAFNRQIRLVAPFAPGGPVDVGARLIAPQLQQALGVQVYVENIPGGSGNIGTAAVAKAPGDGTTILVVSSTLVVNPTMFKLNYDVEKDLSPVSLIAVGPQVILVHPSVPASNMEQLIQLIKSNPNKYSFGSAGIGSPGFLAGVMLKEAFGLDLQHVPFQGGGPAVVSTMAGHTPMVITTISSAASQIASGSLRALAQTGRQRSSALPQVPTLDEQGIRDQESDILLGLLVPSKTPKAIIDRLHLEVTKMVVRDDFKEKLAVVGFDAVGSTPDEFRDRIRSETSKWSQVIKASGLLPQ